MKTSRIFRLATIFAAMVVSSFSSYGQSFGHYRISSYSSAYVIDLSSGAVISPWQQHVGSGFWSDLFPQSNVYYLNSANSGSLEGISTISTAAASLIDGSLRNFSSVENFSVPDRRVESGSISDISDTFYFSSASGESFVWANNESVSLNVHIDGTQLLNATALADTSGVSGPNGVATALRLNVSTNGVDWSNATWQQAAWQPSVSGPGPGESQTFFFYGSFGVSQTIPMMGSFTGTDIASGFDITFTFEPGADFVWALQLESSAVLDSSLGLGSSINDLSHTATLNFNGPVGSVFTSASGVFPGSVTAVPEPQTYALLLSGLFVLIAAARRRGVTSIDA